MLVSAIAGMTRAKKLGVSFVTGFGAQGSFDIPGLRDNLQDRYTVRSVDLTNDSTVLNKDSTTVLVLASPTQTLDSAAVRHFETFVDSGGAALLLLPPVTIDNQRFMPVPIRSGLEGLPQVPGCARRESDGHGSRVQRAGVAGAPGSLQRDLALSAVAHRAPAGDNPITQGLNAVTMAWPGAVDVGDSAQVTPLLQTSKAGALRGLNMPINPDQDWNTVPKEDLGVRTVAVAEDPGPDGARRSHGGRG